VRKECQAESATHARQRATHEKHVWQNRGRDRRQRVCVRACVSVCVSPSLSLSLSRARALSLSIPLHPPPSLSVNLLALDLFDASHVLIKLSRTQGLVLLQTACPWRDWRQTRTVSSTAR
jgi:hypothetical protein